MQSAQDPPAEDALPEPDVASVMQDLLSSVGIQEYDMQVVDLLTDFVYSYAKDVLKDAQAYGEAAGQPPGTVDLRDVELAIRSRTDMSFSGGPSLQMLNETAEAMNKRELPAIDGRRGLPLPGNQALLAPNVQYQGWDADKVKPTTTTHQRQAPADPVLPEPSAPFGVPSAH